MYVWMDGWMHGCMDACMGEWMDGLDRWIDGWIDGLVVSCLQDLRGNGELISLPREICTVGLHWQHKQEEAEANLLVALSGPHASTSAGLCTSTSTTTEEAEAGAGQH
jgi:hypothetical protein